MDYTVGAHGDAIMPAAFQVGERLVGLSAHAATGQEKPLVQVAELVPPQNPARVQLVLEALHATVFSRIPGFPDPSQVRHLVVIVRQDLSATAYINELRLLANVKVNRAVVIGEPAYAKDIAEIREVSLGIDVPDDAGVVVVTSIGWRRSVYFDFGPFTDVKTRVHALPRVLASQMLMLLGLEDAQPTLTRVDLMADGFQALQRLLRERCEEEEQYQELLHTHPWMLGGTYVEIMRHKEHGHSVRGQRNIPDFTATRSADQSHDIIELKQPFLNCFKKDEAFSAEFNDSWNQAERYLVAARTDRVYLREHLGLRFENPKCILIVGHEWTESQVRAVRQRESINLSINVLTWDQLISQAAQVLSLMRTASVRG
jgi:Domain of unknown function (DUF4263)